jgi:hypothetical protein
VDLFLSSCTNSGILHDVDDDLNFAYIINVDELQSFYLIITRYRFGNGDYETTSINTYAIHDLKYCNSSHGY